MIRAGHVHARGAWSGAPAARITLDETARRRRRMRMVADDGLEFLLDLRETVLLRDGDGIALDDGRIVGVIAAPEPLLEVRAASRAALMRLAWHIGNRHLAAELHDDRILIRRDHVIAAMLTGLGATVSEVVRPFNPEGGAYGGHHHHGHGHAGHDHG